MMQVDIEIHPGGWADNKRLIQRIAIWNISDLADVSDYEYAVSRPYSWDTIGKPPSGLWMAHNRLDDQVAYTGTIFGHPRASEPWELVLKVLASLQ